MSKNRMGWFRNQSVCVCRWHMHVGIKSCYFLHALRYSCSVFFLLPNGINADIFQQSQDISYSKSLWPKNLATHRSHSLLSAFQIGTMKICCFLKLFLRIYVWCIFLKLHNNCTVYPKLTDHSKYPFCCGVPQNWKERKI